MWLVPLMPRELCEEWSSGGNKHISPEHSRFTVIHVLDRHWPAPLFRQPRSNTTGTEDRNTTPTCTLRLLHGKGEPDFRHIPHHSHDREETMRYHK